MCVVVVCVTNTSTIRCISVGAAVVFHTVTYTNWCVLRVCLSWKWLINPQSTSVVCVYATTVMPVYNIDSNEILKRVFVRLYTLYLPACLLSGLWNETTYYTQRPSNKIIWTNAAAAVRVKQPIILYKILFHRRYFSAKLLKKNTLIIKDFIITNQQIY